MVDCFPFNGIGVDEGVTDTDEGETGDEAKKCGVGNAGGEFGAGGKEADQDSGHTGEVKN